MAAPSTNTLQATITATDSSGNTSVNRGFGNPSFPGQVGDMVINQTLNNGANTLALPISGSVTGIQNIYIKNNAAPGGGTVTITLILNGGIGFVSGILQPGGVYVVWNVASPPVAASQYTSISLTASVANVPVEYFLGG